MYGAQRTIFEISDCKVLPDIVFPNPRPRFHWNSPWIVMSKEQMAPNESKRIVREHELAVVWFLAIGLLLASSSSFACSCAVYPADEAKAVAMAYGRADAIFLGVVTAVKSKILLPLPVRDATFEVMVSWKGLSGFDRTVVRAAISESACGFKFRKQGRYLVFANWDSKKGILRTNMCELTREESEAQGLIKELDALNQLEESNPHGADGSVVQRYL
jgi:hypothetical protein